MSVQPVSPASLKSLVDFAQDRIDTVIERLNGAIDKLLEYASQTVILDGFDEYEAVLLTDMLMTLVKNEIEKLEEYLAYARRLKKLAEDIDEVLESYKNVIATNYSVDEFYQFYV